MKLLDMVVWIFFLKVIFNELIVRVWEVCDNFKKRIEMVEEEHYFQSPLKYIVATLAFGLRLRQGGWEVAGLEVDPRVTSHAPGSAKSAKSVREW